MLFIYMLLNINITHAQETNEQWKWDKNSELKYEICSDSNVKKEKVKAYVYYMIDEYNIDLQKKDISVYYNTNCPTNPKHESRYDETIFIKSFQQNSRQYAKTDLRWTMYGNIKYIDNATINYPNYLDNDIKEKVLLHEIGHSLGMPHDPTDDIMSPVIHRWLNLTQR